MAISLESWIWDAAYSIRGAKDAPKYKDYILPLIFTKRLGLDDFEADIIGESYEYLIRKFAEGGGQSAGDFYTPPVVGTNKEKTVRQWFVDHAELKKNDHNISPSRYIHTSDAETCRPIAEIVGELEAIEAEAKEADADLRGCEKIPETGECAKYVFNKTMAYGTSQVRFS